MKSFVLLAGSSNQILAYEVAKHLGVNLGKVELEEFPNRELRIRILEDVQGKDVYILQSMNYPAERYLFELALLADAARRNNAAKIVAVIPWLGYSPQDKVFRQGEPLSSQVMITMLSSTDVDEFVTVDIHSFLSLNMFTKKVTHLSAMKTFIKHFQGELRGEWCSVALDKGALNRAHEFADALHLPLVTFEKSRDRLNGKVTFHCLKGDVAGKHVITFDDYVSTGSTTMQSCDFLKKEGAQRCYYCITHIVVESTLEKIESSAIDKMFITDSIAISSSQKFKKLRVISIAPLIGDWIVNKEVH